MSEPNIRRWLVPSVIVIILLLIVSLGTFDSGNTIVGAVIGAGPDGSAYTGTTPLPGTTSPPARSHTQHDQPPAASAGTIVTATGLLLPLRLGPGTGTSLAAFAGERAVGNRVPVQAVDANEGFWVGTSSQDRMWVQLVGPPPESPYSVKAGDTISFSAPVVTNSRRFAHDVGVSKSEGADQLNTQGEHIAIRKTTLKLHRG